MYRKMYLFFLSFLKYKILITFFKKTEEDKQKKSSKNIPIKI